MANNEALIANKVRQARDVPRRLSMLKQLIADDPQYIPVHNIIIKKFQSINQQITEKFDVQLTDVLGCGVYGCVFSTQNPKFVVKLTTEVFDAAFALYLYQQIQTLPRSLPRIYGVTRINLPTIRRNPLYAIVREPIDDFTKNGKVSTKTLINAHHMYELGCRLSSNALPLKYPCKKTYHPTTTILDRPAVQKHTYLMEPGARDPYKIVGDEQQLTYVAEYIGELANWLADHGLCLCDLHHENWGKRPGTKDLVVRDTGCIFATTTEAQNLQSRLEESLAWGQLLVGPGEQKVASLSPLAYNKDSSWRPW